MQRKTPRLSEPAVATTGRLVGYARVSTSDQDVAMQVQALVRAGVNPDNIHTETVSGVKKIRPMLEWAIKVDCRPGDCLVVYKLDRLGRSLADLIAKVADLTERGIGFRSLSESMDTTTPGGKLLFHVIGALAQFERDLIAERTRDGVLARKERGLRVGAPVKMTPARIEEAKRRIAAGELLKDIAADFGVHPQTLYVRWPRAKVKRLRRQAQK
jgi:DNA invertase Pin-like site-specific DNA recombinase